MGRDITLTSEMITSILPQAIDECKKLIATHEQKISDNMNEVWESNNK